MKSKVYDLFKRANLSESITSIDYLEKGYSNKCFKVCTDKGNVYKVRIAHNNDVINRKNELCILKNANVSFLYYDENNGDSVWKWIEGSDLMDIEINEEIINQLVKITEDLHNKNTDGVLNHNDLEYSTHPVGCITKQNLKTYEKIVTKYAEDSRCLCHNDISLSNLIYDPSSKKLSFIDYEWGRVNNPYWDYGNFVKEADLSEEIIKMLASKANLNILKLYEFAILSSWYSIQLSYVFKEQTEGLEKYRNRLLKQLNKYRKWLSKQ